MVRGLCGETLAKALKMAGQLPRHGWYIWRSLNGPKRDPGVRESPVHLSPLWLLSFWNSHWLSLTEPGSSKPIRELLFSITSAHLSCCLPACASLWVPSFSLPLHLSLSRSLSVFSLSLSLLSLLHPISVFFSFLLSLCLWVKLIPHGGVSQLCGNWNGCIDEGGHTGVVRQTAGQWRSLLSTEDISFIIKDCTHLSSLLRSSGGVGRICINCDLFLAGPGIKCAFHKRISCNST